MDWWFREATEWAKNVEKDAARYRDLVSPRDPKLGEKIKKIGEQAGEVHKHVEERSDPKRG